MLMIYPYSALTLKCDLNTEEGVIFNVYPTRVSRTVDEFVNEITFFTKCSSMRLLLVFLHKKEREKNAYKIVNRNLTFYFSSIYIP